MAEIRRKTVKKDKRTGYSVQRIASFFVFFCLLSSVFCLLSNVIYACPACNDLVTFGKNAAQAMRFGNGIAWSMLLMFSAPVLMMGALVWFVVRAERRRLKLERGEKV